MTSVPGRAGLLFGSAYSASKHGLIGFTASLAAEVVREGITVNGVSPGPVHSATNDRRVAFDAKRLGKPLEDYLATMTPLGRRLEPEEVTPTVVFLASTPSPLSLRVKTSSSRQADFGYTAKLTG